MGNEHVQRSMIRTTAGSLAMIERERERERERETRPGCEIITKGH